MVKSEPILPIRFYDSLFDQQRFNFHCKDASQLELIYPSNELPHFQFTRNKKFELPDMFYLRNVCNDVALKYYKDIPESAANFGAVGSDAFYGAFPKGAIVPDHPPYGIQFLILECSKLKPNISSVPPVFAITSNLDIPLSDTQVWYDFKIVVDKFVNASTTFFIKIYNDTQLIGVITGPGIFNFKFYSNDAYVATPQITLTFENFTNIDDFEISYVQASTTGYFYTTFTNDVSLDENYLKVVPMNNGEDIIVYCQSNQNYNIPAGEYYYVVVSGSDIYYSEVFKVISLREIENYYRLKWFSSCDINDDILYRSAILDCNYYNTLFLDAALFKPEYETKEEGQENGKGDLTVELQTWKKFINFEIAKCPEFLADAFSGVFLHDNIFIRKPLNFRQETANNEFTVQKVISDITSMLQDCFQKVTLKLLLNDKYSDTGCCNEAEIFDCTPCLYNAGNCGDPGVDYYLAMPPTVGVPGLYRCYSNTQVIVRSNDLICDNGKYYTIAIVGSAYAITSVAPSITSATFAWFSYVLVCQGLPNTFAEMQYNKNGAGWVTFDLISIGSTGAFASYVSIFLMSGATDFDVRFINKTLTCVLGTSDLIDII